MKVEDAAIEKYPMGETAHLIKRRAFIAGANWQEHKILSSGETTGENEAERGRCIKYGDWIIKRLFPQWKNTSTPDNAGALFDLYLSETQTPAEH